jgi:hypothetical protein
MTMNQLCWQAPTDTPFESDTNGLYVEVLIDRSRSRFRVASPCFSRLAPAVSRSPDYHELPPDKQRFAEPQLFKLCLPRPQDCIASVQAI